MRDRALGKSKAERSGMFPINRNNEFRVNNPGMFSGPRPSYGRYQVGSNASDILNKSLNKGTR
jgi:hypothetical protein